MFTGIIETVGKVTSIRKEGTNVHFQIASTISDALKVDQSVAHNGVCLTVTEISAGCHWVTAVDETLKKSTLGSLQEQDRVNMERCMKADGRFDGHIVQGHVDTTAEVVSIKNEGGSWTFTFRLHKEGMLVEKGSVCINGISLTCFNVREDHFSVAIIPYTFEQTNLKNLASGDRVNIEFDIIGKYIQLIVKKK